MKVVTIVHGVVCVLALGLMINSVAVADNLADSLYCVEQVKHKIKHTDEATKGILAISWCEANNNIAEGF